MKITTIASTLFFAGLLVGAGCATGTTVTDPPEAGPSTTCGAGSQTCNGTCTVIARDPENCGVCGGKCKDGEVCSMGKCAPGCAGGSVACGQSCVDTQTDRTNCGACGTMCGGGEECVAGKCTLTCQPGLTQCPNNYADAGASDAGSFGPQVCVDTWVDRFNCGACGNVCPPAKPLCKQGSCQNPPSTCNNTACMQGSDVTNANLKWVVCQADCNTAWVSHLTSGGGQYHAEWICKQLGYNTFNQQSGTCNDVCSYCQANTSCNAPGPKTFTGGGTCGSDQYGKILCNTVMWQCTL